MKIKLINVYKRFITSVVIYFTAQTGTPLKVKGATIKTQKQVFTLVLFQANWDNCHSTNNSNRPHLTNTYVTFSILLEGKHHEGQDFSIYIVHCCISGA